MWGGVASQSAWLFFVVCLNSFIHTLMYAYFFVKTLYPKLHIKQARYLTSMQIGQFFTGIIGSSGVLLMGNACASAAARLSLFVLHAYGYGLIFLFTAMFKKKYKSS